MNPLALLPLLLGLSLSAALDEAERSGESWAARAEAAPSASPEPGSSTPAADEPQGSSTEPPFNAEVGTPSLPPRSCSRSTRAG